MLRHDEPIDPMAAAEIRVLSDDDSGAVARASRSWANALPAWLDLAHEGSSVFLLAVVDGSPLGVAELRPGRIAEIRNVGVLPPARGRGIGTDLMHAAEKRCAPATAVRLRVGLDNPGARRLYERLGYAGTGELQTTTYEFRDADGHLRSATETDEWMEKRLAGLL
ncbi:GNAT family N-acetyltransferase [Brachybacterium sp. AOP3-A1-3]|uniref:GNAT family N-acetyltransferase n=1 Tax=Brachybacterium sp. AOP3-A1-3 TaxID=3457699 RepID=UPI003FB8EDD9